MTAIPEFQFHVYPTDCDMLGHLNHATMLQLLERARWAFLEPHISMNGWHREEVFPVVRHVDIGYTAQTLPGEDVVVRSGMIRVGRTSWTIRQEVRKVGSNVLVADAKMVFVAIDRRGVPVPVPPAWLDVLPVWPADAS